MKSQNKLSPNSSSIYEKKESNVLKHELNYEYKNIVNSINRNMQSAHKKEIDTSEQTKPFDESKDTIVEKKKGMDPLELSSGPAKDTTENNTDNQETRGEKTYNKNTNKIIKSFKNISLSHKTSNEEQKTASISNINKGVDIKDVIVDELLQHKRTKWSDLRISSNVVNLLLENGYEFPSPVQYQSIPDIIKGVDVLVRAKNGTGKSLSFIIPILDKIDMNSNTLQAIILVPIRELALQIAKTIKCLCKNTQVRSMPLVGGSNLADDIIRLTSGVHILVGTPGRILDIMEKNICNLNSNSIIIFDEADKLLDSIFFESIYRLLAFLPKKRQICLFSATFPSSIKSFVEMNMNNPKLIKVNNEYTLSNITQFYIKVKKETKLPCLKSILQSLNINQCIIYCNGIRSAQMLAQKITETGFSCYFIHSQISQDERNTVYHNFSRNKCQILVSTDITTRGIDVRGINVVINFDLPLSSESYLHRLGRAGRFGTKGCCISLINEEEKSTIYSFAKFVGSEVYPACDEKFKSFCK